MTDAWLHHMCGECWIERQTGDFARLPMRLVEWMQDDEECCFCDGDTRLGIMVRHDPSELLCEHAEARAEVESKA